MLEMLKPCVEEGFVIQEREVALDFIGRRGYWVLEEKTYSIRQGYSSKGIITNITQEEGFETRKAFF